MVSRDLCGAFALEAISLLVLMAALFGDAAVSTRVLLATCAAFILVNAFAVMAVYAILRQAAANNAQSGAAKARHSWRCAIGELLALFTSFVIIQPFERWWMGSDAVGPVGQGRIPVLLVHGYLCNRGLWWRLRRRLRARQHAVATVNLQPPLAGLDELAKRLGERIDALLAETGALKIVLVTHSMGGLIARAYLQQHGAAHIAGLVTLAAPHQGTLIAGLGWGRNARQMIPNSEWLQRLNALPAPPIPIANIWSLDDEIVAPPESSRFPGAQESVLSGLGHMALVFSPAVLARVEDELTPSPSVAP